MNALPQRCLVDTSGTDSRRATQLVELCRQVALTCYPWNEERAGAMTRQLAFTSWYASARAVDRRSSLFSVTPEHLAALRDALMRSVYQHDLARFLATTGLPREALFRLDAEDLIDLSVHDDILAAALCMEVYRLGGPLPWKQDAATCARTWFSRYCILKGVDRERNQPVRERHFQSEAEHLISLLGPGLAP
jgi:hypothetical protein